jgi:hypothetical protein
MSGSNGVIRDGAQSQRVRTASFWSYSNFRSWRNYAAAERDRAEYWGANAGTGEPCSQTGGMIFAPASEIRATRTAQIDCDQTGHAAGRLA